MIAIEGNWINQAQVAAQVIRAAHHAIAAELGQLGWPAWVQARTHCRVTGGWPPPQSVTGFAKALRVTCTITQKVSS